MLGVLAAHHGSYVPVDRLVEALWEEEPPKTAKTIVQLKVSQLRKTLGERIAGYSLAVPADEADLGRSVCGAGSPSRASAPRGHDGQRSLFTTSAAGHPGALDHAGPLWTSR